MIQAELKNHSSFHFSLYYLWLFITALLLFTPYSSQANIDTTAEYAYMLDADTGTVLLNKDGDTQMNPSSMSKLMTTYILFEDLKKGSISLDSTLSVSEKAWKMGGSKMFVPPSAIECHPREEHLLPLHVCFGIAGEDGAAELIFNEDLMGKRVSSFQWN